MAFISTMDVYLLSEEYVTLSVELFFTTCDAISLSEEDINGYIVATDSDVLTRLMDFIWLLSTITSISTGLVERTMEEV